MNTIARRFAPSTLQGQITLVILIAVLAVIIIGRSIEPLRRSGPMAVADLDGIVYRTAMVAQLLSHSNEDERRWLLARTASLGMDVAIVDEASLRTLVAESDGRFTFSRWVFELFPPDTYVGSEINWDIADGRPFFWTPVDNSSVLVVRNLPLMTATSDFVGPLTYYVLAFGTLLVLFSVYAARSVARPVARIAEELDRSDGVVQDTPIDERGTVEMIRLARAVNEMRARVRSMIEMRMRMLRSVSHDLRTPLTRLRLRAERLDNPVLRDAITADIDHIDTLVGETLAYLRSDAVEEADESVDVASLLQTIAAEFTDVGFSVRYKGPDRLSTLCKAVALTRAVNNLCDNALKFGREAVILLVQTKGEIWIDVADDGPGIPLDKRALVLEPFFKLDGARSPAQKGGFGLGLSIVSDIVKAHDGTLELHDRDPQGLIVRLRLPERRPTP